MARKSYDLSKKRFDNMFKAYKRNWNNWKKKGYSMADRMNKREFREMWGKAQDAKDTSNFSKRMAEADRDLTRQNAQGIWRALKGDRKVTRKTVRNLLGEGASDEAVEQAYNQFNSHVESKNAVKEDIAKKYGIENWKDILSSGNAHRIIADMFDAGLIKEEDRSDFEKSLGY